MWIIVQRNKLGLCPALATQTVFVGTIIVCFRCFRGFIENNKKYRLLPGNHAIVNQKRKHSCVVGTFLTSPTSPKPVLCFALQHCSKIQLKKQLLLFFFKQLSKPTSRHNWRWHCISYWYPHKNSHWNAPSWTHLHWRASPNLSTRGQMTSRCQD